MSYTEMADKMNYNKRDMFRFSSNTFFCNRAPDFLHSMSIVWAYLHKWKAEDSIRMVGNRLVYDWRKDGRYSLLANPNSDKTSDQYKM
jgi:hypothetical protein